ncbi:MAG TPA: TetR/AcrR family transcriptional regulator [Polyangiaceae bacterium]
MGPAAKQRRRSGASGAKVAPGPGRYDRTQPLDARRTEQRTRLLRAAAQVFALHGFTGASVDLIIREVRMSRRTFYEHFRDLEEVLVEVYETGARILSARVEEAVNGQADPTAKVREGILAYLTAMRDSAPLARVLYHEIHAIGPSHRKRHEAMRDRYVQIWRAGFQEAYDAGHARRVPDELTVYALSTAIEAVAMRYLDHGEEDRILEAAPALISIAVTAVQYSDEDIRRLLVAAALAPQRPRHAKRGKTRDALPRS